MELVWPSERFLEAYSSALRRGWSPDNIRGQSASLEELKMISDDPTGFVSRIVDIEAKGQTVKLPDGKILPRIPGYRRWMWDGEFCGSISFRWVPDSSKLPDYVLGHLGFSVVPWKQGQGYAKLALKLLLPEAKSKGLDYVDITTDINNVKSQRVIKANGGILVEQFKRPVSYGASDALLYRIDLSSI